MKIKKFNESTVTGDKWTEDEIDNTILNYELISGSIIEFLSYTKPEKLKLAMWQKYNDNIENYTVYEMRFCDPYNDNNYFSANFKSKNGRQINYTFSKDESGNLIEFMNDPDMYKEKDKYNL